MCERTRAVLTWRSLFRKRHKLQRKIRRLLDLDEQLAEQLADADHQAARLIRREGPIKLDGKRYSCRLESHFGVYFATLQIDPLEPEALLAVGAHNVPGVVP